MKQRLLILFSLGLASMLALQALAADVRLGPPCEPGYQWVEQTTYKEVVHYTCKIVPDVKKKWVYSTIDDPFCIPCGLTGGCCCSHCSHGGCGTCQGPFPRKLLVKKEVELPCAGRKCVVEKIVDKVPCTEYRKVPIEPAQITPPAEIMPPPPTPPNFTSAENLPPR